MAEKNILDTWFQVLQDHPGNLRKKMIYNLQRVKHVLGILDLEQKIENLAKSMQNATTDVFKLTEDLTAIKVKLHMVLAPVLRERIVCKLREDGGAHTWRWIDNRLYPYELRFSDLNALVDDGRLFILKSGTHKLYTAVKPNDQ